MAAAITLIIYLFFTAIANSAETYKYKTHVMHIGEEFIFSWEAVEYAEWYEIRAKHFEQDQLINQTTWNTIEIQIKTKYPRWGHLIWEVRACRKDAERKNDCSSYSISTDPEVALENEPWWTYGFVAPPGKGGIN